MSWRPLAKFGALFGGVRAAGDRLPSLDELDASTTSDSASGEEPSVQAASVTAYVEPLVEAAAEPLSDITSEFSHEAAAELPSDIAPVLTDDAAPEPAPPAPPPVPLGPKLLLLGTCQTYPLVAEAEGQNVRVDHYLLGCEPHDDIGIASIDFAAYDASIVAPVLRHVLAAVAGANELIFWRLDEAGVQTLTEDCIRYMDAKIARLAEVIAGPVIITGYWEPSFLYAGPMFRFDPALDFKEFVHQLNIGLRKSCRSHANCWFLDPNLVLESIGRNGAQDDVASASTHAAFLGDWDHDHDQTRIVPQGRPTEIFGAGDKTRQYGQGMLREITGFVAALTQTEKIKLIIVDLDDTLWRGIAAEDDVHFSIRREGWPLGFVEALLVFKRRGGLLGICSKNTRDETLARLKSIWGELITEADFASISISWNPKPDGIAAILRDVNVLPEHTLFIDDNPREIDEVRATFPSMKFSEPNHYLWRQRILSSPDTQVARITAESANRTALVRAKVERDSSVVGLDRGAWLRSMALTQLNAVINSTGDRQFDRALELINKTNQFNTNGRRWTAGEMASLFEEGGFLVVSTLADKNIDNGLIGVVVVHGEVIEQAVLSCRVFNLGAEVGMFHDAVRLILTTHARAVGSVVPTGRNFVCQDLYDRLGFRREGEVFVTETPPKPPEWIAQTHAELHAEAA